MDIDETEPRLICEFNSNPTLAFTPFMATFHITYRRVTSRKLVRDNIVTTRSQVRVGNTLSPPPTSVSDMMTVHYNDNEATHDCIDLLLSLPRCLVALGE